MYVRLLSHFLHIGKDGDALLTAFARCFIYTLEEIASGARLNAIAICFKLAVIAVKAIEGILDLRHWVLLK
jgi:hypothetical protein